MELSHKEYLTLKEIVGRYEKSLSNPNLSVPIKVRNKEVWETNCSVRLYNVFHNMGVDTIGDMLEKSVVEFVSQRNFGRRCMEELKEIYSDNGWTLIER
jgi:DNA-directed RNA polymerase alpha subunit